MSKHNDGVRIAHQKGYRVGETGVVTSHRGVVLKLRLGTGNYPRYSFSVKAKTVEYHVSVHRLMAFQKFGEAMFDPRIQVRHHNGDALDNCESNILLGTPSENMMDVPAEFRRLRSQKAGKARSPHSDEKWAQIKEDYQNGLSYGQIEEKYGVNRSTLSFQLSKKSKYRTLANR